MEESSVFLKYVPTWRRQSTGIVWRVIIPLWMLTDGIKRANENVIPRWRNESKYRVIYYDNSWLQMAVGINTRSTSRIRRVWSQAGTAAADPQQSSALLHIWLARLVCPAVCLPFIAVYVYKAYKRTESLVQVVLGINTSYLSRARTFDWFFPPTQHDSEKGPHCPIDFTISRFVTREYY